MAIVVPVLRESERAIEALRAAEGALWAEQLADLITLAARCGDRRQGEIAGASLNQSQGAKS